MPFPSCFIFRPTKRRTSKPVCRVGGNFSPCATKAPYGQVLARCEAAASEIVRQQGREIVAEAITRSDRPKTPVRAARHRHLAAALAEGLSSVEVHEFHREPRPAFRRDDRIQQGN